MTDHFFGPNFATSCRTLSSSCTGSNAVPRDAHTQPDVARIARERGRSNASPMPPPTSGVHGPLTRLGFRTFCHRCRHCTSVRPSKYSAMRFQFFPLCCFTALRSRASCVVATQARSRRETWLPQRGTQCRGRGRQPRCYNATTHLLGTPPGLLGRRVCMCALGAGRLARPTARRASLARAALSYPLMRRGDSMGRQRMGGGRGPREWRTCDASYGGIGLR